MLTMRYKIFYSFMYIHKFEMVATQEYGLVQQRRPFHPENVQLGYQCDLNHNNINTTNYQGLLKKSCNSFIPLLDYMCAL